MIQYCIGFGPAAAIKRDSKHSGVPLSVICLYEIATFMESIVPMDDEMKMNEK
jgi:hypothetical protein